MTLTGAGQRDATHETDHLRFWRGQFGDAYTDRNTSTAVQLRARVNLWARILRSFVGAPPVSILEVGANIGNNLRALAALTGAELYALEPNARARERLLQDQVVQPGRAFDGFAASIPLADGAVDLAFTSGVLIHIHPDQLYASCQDIYRVARRYLVSVEYFADQPDQVPYRGHGDRLFRRDFGSFWLDNFADLRLLDYGFAWKPATGLDNLTWWAFEKR